MSNNMVIINSEIVAISLQFTSNPSTLQLQMPKQRFNFFAIFQILILIKLIETQFSPVIRISKIKCNAVNSSVMEIHQCRIRSLQNLTGLHINYTYHYPVDTPFYVRTLLFLHYKIANEKSYFQLTIDLEFKSGGSYKRVIEPQNIELCAMVAGGGITNAFVNMIFSMFKESAPRVFMPCPHYVSF